MRLTAITLALLLGVSGAALAGSGKDNQDDDKGGGNQPHAPGQTTNPNPGKLFDDSAPVWLDGFVVAGDNVAPGSGNWGGGPGNSGPGDQNGTNGKSKDGGQTPNDDK